MKENILEDLHFNFFDFNISHKLLTIRASQLNNRGEFYNMDVVFKGVFYIEAITSMEGIRIEKADEADLKNIASKCNNINFRKGLNLFKIITLDNVFFIGAINYELKKNNLPPLKKVDN